VLTSRVEPTLPLARWRASGQLLELRAADLRFAIDDSARLLALVAAQDLAPDTAQALVERTEGWAAGLHLAGLVLRSGHPGEQSALVAQISGSHPYILDYLVDEILRSQSPEIQSFLLQTSILERLCAELCDAMIGDQLAPSPLLSQSSLPQSSLPQSSLPRSSSELLAMLERSNLFITPLDTERRWFRYHQLFADALQSQLQRTYPTRIKELHRRAMEWYRQQATAGAIDFVTPAINHAIAAGEYGAAALLIERHGLAMLLVRGEIQTLLGWVSLLPETLRRARPRILVAEAWAFLATVQIDRAEQIIEIAEAGAAPEDGELIGEMSAIRSFVLRINGEPQASIELGQRSLALLGSEQKTVLYLMAVNMVNAYLELGNLRGAWAIFEQMRRDLRYLPDPAVLLSGYGLELVEADLLLGEGRAIEAEAVVRQVLKQIVGRYGERLTILAMIHVALAEICYERNNLEECERLTRSGLEKGEQWWNSDILCPAYDLLGRILRVRGDHGGAIAAHRKSRELAVAYNVPKITWWAQLGEVWEAFDQGDLAATERRLVERGLRIDAPFDPTRYHEYELLVRLRLAQSRVAEASSLITQLLLLAEQGGYTRRVIRATLLAALADQQAGQMDAACAAIGQALELAAPGGMLRCFLDEGEPMQRLLVDLLSRTQVAHDLRSYVLQVLAMFPSGSEPPLPQPTQIPRSLLPAPDRLTDRELEVLRLVAIGEANQQIADRLVVSLHTVKKHLTHVLAKLGTTSRTAAVARAREQNLL
jgi:LuxR family maltose regulon positive regulatory protein